jgi:hypothetical protein
MPATLTWTTHGPYTFTIGGANPTVLETLAGLNSTAANLTYWSVSDYSNANGTLEMKRNSVGGAPAGELATVRMLIFGKTAPNSAALINGASAGATTVLYAGLSVDANTTGPSAAYGSAAPYSTKYTRAGMITTPSTQLTTANSPKITWFEADDVLGFSISDSANMCSCVMGRIIVGTDSSTLLWGVMPTGTAASYGLTTNAGTTTVGSAHPITTFGQIAAGGKAAMWDPVGAAAAQVGRNLGWMNTQVDPGLGANTAAAMLVPMPLVYAPQSAAPGSGTFVGTLRQIRLGPQAQHLQKLRDNSSVLQATHILGGSSTGTGLWLDELP